MTPGSAPFRQFAFAVALPLLALYLTSTHASEKPSADPSASGTIVLVYPSSSFGGIVTIDNKAKKGQAGKRTLSISVQPGVLDLYGTNASRPRASLTVDASRPLYVIDRDDPEATSAAQGLMSGHDHRTAFVNAGKNRRPSGKTKSLPGMASVVLLTPGSIFGGPVARILVDGKLRKVKTGSEQLEALVMPRHYAVYGSGSLKPVTVDVDSGELVYVVNRNNGLGQRRLGDLFFSSGNFKGAQALYKNALAADSAMTDLYARYADLATQSGDRSEAIRALSSLVASGRADGRAYQKLGDLFSSVNRNDEARAMYDKALAVAGEDAAVLTALARVKAKTGDLEGAAAAYAQAIRLQPDSTRLYKAMGDVLLRQKDTARVVESYQKFLEKGGRNSAVALFMGAYEFARAHSEDAVRYLSMLTGKDAQGIRYLRMLGESHFRLGNFAKAGVPLRTAATKYTRSSEWPAVVEMLIESYVSLKDYKKAAYWIDICAKSGKGNSSTVAYYRAFLKERSSSAEARSLYEKNTKKYPGDYRNFLRFGVLLSADPASLTTSLVMLRKAVSLADTVPDAWLEISRVYRKLNSADEELRSLQVFVTTHPQHPEANARIGELMLKKGAVDEAMERLQAVDRDSVDDPAVLKALAQGYAQTGAMDRAIEALVRAKAAAPNDTFIRLRLIDLYRATRQGEKVLEEYKGVVELRHDNPTILKYAELLYENSRYDEAVSAIEDIRATQPENTEALMLLGHVLRAQEKYLDAIKIYEEISFIDPKHVNAIYERAETYLLNGQPHWAESFYKRVLTRNPKFALAELGLAKVAKMRRSRDEYNLHLRRAHALAPNDAAVEQEREASAQGW